MKLNPPLQFVFFLVATGPEKKIGPVPDFFLFLLDSVGKWMTNPDLD